MSAPESYIGEELELFAKATNWKRYILHEIAPFLGRSVLEVGAGLGATTAQLCVGEHDEWRCLEPDPTMAATLATAVADARLPRCCTAQRGSSTDVARAGETFDSVLYIDVLEHIEDDLRELQRAARLLKPGGRIIVLSPAHPWLFSDFDRAIGHFRRYTKRSLNAAAPPGLTREALKYVDAAGVAASFANRTLLRSARPTQRQILFWDRVLVPISRRTDAWFGHRIGRSVLGVWRDPRRVT